MAVGKKTHILYDKVIEKMICFANFENPIEPGHFGEKKTRLPNFFRWSSPGPGLPSILLHRSHWMRKCSAQAPPPMPNTASSMAPVAG
jgi:hypothetical protein